MSTPCHRPRVPTSAPPRPSTTSSTRSFVALDASRSGSDRLAGSASAPSHRTRRHHPARRCRRVSSPFCPSTSTASNTWPRSGGRRCIATSACSDPADPRSRSFRPGWRRRRVVGAITDASSSERQFDDDEADRRHAQRCPTHRRPGAEAFDSCHLSSTRPSISAWTTKAVPAGTPAKLVELLRERDAVSIAQRQADLTWRRIQGYGLVGLVLLRLLGDERFHQLAPSSVPHRCPRSSAAPPPRPRSPLTDLARQPPTALPCSRCRASRREDGIDIAHDHHGARSMSRSTLHSA